MAKRKRPSADAETLQNLSNQESQGPLKPPRRLSSRAATAATANAEVANPRTTNGNSKLEASGGEEELLKQAVKPRAIKGKGARNTANAKTSIAGEDAATEATSPPSNEASSVDLRAQPARNKRKAPSKHVNVDGTADDNPPVKALLQDASPMAQDAAQVEAAVGLKEDPESDESKDADEDEEVVKEALSRPPPVNSDILPLPWKGRLGYACLNTYLRNANPPVFSSRTCRIASIIEHRHPLKDPSQPEHATKNRPDRDQPADIARGMRYVEELGLTNARDIIKMIRWNDRFGIKFMRLSSEMFPFASHLEYGYKLTPFASETLAEVGKVIAELGHRVTTHPGQFTQLGSPRKEVITAAIRDLEYHDEMLSLLKLPPQQDRDAVMILHLGGVFGDRKATLDRFRENYAKLSDSVKRRLVLENDDVSWSVHDLLPLCQELNIPLVLDFHHHNIIFDSSKIREGTKDIVDMFPEILATWERKGVTPKMHYSEPCPDAVTGRDRRKHSPRVKTLPPCPNNMDLMIEAKDKEQAVFELMRNFKLPGHHLFSDVIQHVREDENKPFKPKPKKTPKKGRKKKTDDLDDLEAKIEDAEEEEKAPPLIPEEEINMGGPLGRVYWPPGQEHWLRPTKRVVKKKEEGATTPAKKKRKTAAAADEEASLNGNVNEVQAPVKKAAPKKAASSVKKKATPKVKAEPTPSLSDDEDSGSPLSDLGDEEDDDAPVVKKKAPAATSKPVRQRSGRASRVSYKEEPEEDADDMSI